MLVNKATPNAAKISKTGSDKPIKADRSSIARAAALARWQRDQHKPAPAKTIVRGKIPSELASFLDGYEKTHQLSSRDAALEHAVLALREKEWGAAYQSYADDLQTQPDIWVDSGLKETLELTDAAAR